MPPVTLQIVSWRVYTQAQMMSFLCITDYEIGDAIWQNMLTIYPSVLYGWTGEVAIWFPQNFVFTFEIVQ